jgi:blue copper oxidase
MFRILSLDGSPPAPHLAGWKDVVLVEDKAELLVRFTQPADRAHPFMYHCHILEHEDAGMMGQYTCT